MVFFTNLDVSFVFLWLTLAKAITLHLVSVDFSQQLVTLPRAKLDAGVWEDAEKASQEIKRYVCWAPSSIVSRGSGLR